MNLDKIGGYRALAEAAEEVHTAAADGEWELDEFAARLPLDLRQEYLLAKLEGAVDEALSEISDAWVGLANLVLLLPEGLGERQMDALAYAADGIRDAKEKLEGALACVNVAEGSEELRAFDLQMKAPPELGLDAARKALRQVIADAAEHFSSVTASNELYVRWLGAEKGEELYNAPEPQ